MYSFIILLYSLAVRTAALFGNKKARLMVRGHHAVWSLLRERVVPDARYIWVHAASLGEFEQGRPLIERIRREMPEKKILLTFFSPSGYEVRKNFPGADIVCYLPFDTLLNVRRFLRLVHPEMLVLVKYEFWFNLIFRVSHRGIPIYSISSIFRPRQIFFRWYGRMYAQCLKRITHFFVQNQESVMLLSRLGITNVTVTGDTRFDRVIDIMRSARELPYVEHFVAPAQQAQQTIVVAGSTWPPDEDILIGHFNAHPEQRLIIAPHVVSEEHLREIESKIQRPAVRLSQLVAYLTAHPEVESPKAQCLIIDGYGLLSSIYRYAHVAYVGGGFGVGIHNVPEAAVYGLPVIIGPNNQRFHEAQQLIAAGGCHEIRTGDDYARLMATFTTDAAARAAAGKASHDYIHGHAGATDLIFRHLFPEAAAAES